MKKIKSKFPKKLTNIVTTATNSNLDNLERLTMKTKKGNARTVQWKNKQLKNGFSHDHLEIWHTNDLKNCNDQSNTLVHVGKKRNIRGPLPINLH